MAKFRNNLKIIDKENLKTSLLLKDLGNVTAFYHSSLLAQPVIVTVRGRILSYCDNTFSFEEVSAVTASLLDIIVLTAKGKGGKHEPIEVPCLPLPRIMDKNRWSIIKNILTNLFGDVAFFNVGIAAGFTIDEVKFSLAFLTKNIRMPNATYGFTSVLKINGDVHPTVLKIIAHAIVTEMKNVASAQRIEEFTNSKDLK